MNNEEKNDINDIYNKSILMIGPMATGKSSISKDLSNKLNMPYISFDKSRMDFYKSIRI